MKTRIHPLSAAIAMAFSCTVGAQQAGSTQQLEDVIVTANRPVDTPEPGNVSSRQIETLRPATSDSASLLRDIPGVYLQSAGGVSSLPTVHGLGDDRLRIRVDGMDLISACANHMNPPLSYIDPSNVGEIKVYSGIVPVSQGGDSIGAAIVVNSRPPLFAKPGEGILSTGELGTFYRSNGNAWGVNANATLATENFSITYRGSTAESENYKAAKSFKPNTLATYTTAGSHMIAGDEVGSTAYKTQNHQLGMAYRLDNHLLDFKVGVQHIPYQGYANQHMDMTDNRSTQFNLGYTGQYNWGKLTARAYHEETHHKMDFAEDKLYWYGSSRNVAGMPMETEGKNTGINLQAEIALSQRDLLRVGSEYQRYRLNDWWDPVANSSMMSPNTFWNIRDGQRDHFDLYGEWEAAWTQQWTTLVGLRGSTVWMDTGNVQGYNSMYAGSTIGGSTYFNAKDHSRTDHNFDFAALARYTPDVNQTYEGGYSRKTRSPSLYERYTWSTNGMAMTMNNWVNDGNGYVGNLDLKPEVAHTLSLAADWHGASRDSWGIKVVPYFSRVENYIDATCAPGKTCTAGKYNYLTLVNQEARLYGLDLSGYAALGHLSGVGDFVARGKISYTRGKNLDTGDNLYNIMPLNARLALEHKLGQWTNTIEEILVAAKDDVSAVRGESKTPGYGLLNLRSSYEWKNLRFDIGLENALDKMYYYPLGGAYTGQGLTMSLQSSSTWSGTTATPYGYLVPGMGRSLYVGMTVKF